MSQTIECPPVELPESLPVEERFYTAYAEHRKIVARVAFGFTGNIQDAEDITQETFLRYSRHMDNIDTSRTALPWLRTVATNIAIDRYRRDRGLKKRSESLEGLGTAAEKVCVVDDIANAVEDKFMINSILVSLTQEHQTILRDVYLLGYSVKEAAHRQGIPLGTAKSRLYYALQNARANLESSL